MVPWWTASTTVKRKISSLAASPRCAKSEDSSSEIKGRCRWLLLCKTVRAAICDLAECHIPCDVFVFIKNWWYLHTLWILFSHSPPLWSLVMDACDGWFSEVHGWVGGYSRYLVLPLSSPSLESHCSFIVYLVLYAFIFLLTYHVICYCGNLTNMLSFAVFFYFIIMVPLKSSLKWMHSSLNLAQNIYSLIYFVLSSSTFSPWFFFFVFFSPLLLFLLSLSMVSLSTWQHFSISNYGWVKVGSH